MFLWCFNAVLWFITKSMGMLPCLSSITPLGRWYAVHGADFVLVAVNASALRRVVDDIDEVGEILHEDGGRDGEAGHADVADFGGYDGGTDGSVGGHGVGFD